MPPKPSLGRSERRRSRLRSLRGGATVNCDECQSEGPDMQKQAELIRTVDRRYRHRRLAIHSAGGSIF
jgi:hypothetical protein